MEAGPGGRRGDDGVNGEEAKEGETVYKRQK